MREDKGKRSRIRFRVSHATPPPQSSDYICAITPSLHGLMLAPSHLPKRPQRIPAPAVALLLLLLILLLQPLLGSSLLSAYYHALRPLLLAPTLTLSVTHLLRPGSDYQPIAGRRREGKESKEGGGEKKKKKGNCLENNCSLTPCSDSRGSALTRTAGIPSSINILFLRLPVKEHRGGVRRVFLA